MPGVLPCDSNGLSRGTPSKKSRLSLKFFQKRETKRALDFTESQENEQKPSEYVCSEMYVRVYYAISYDNISLLWVFHFISMIVSYKGFWKIQNFINT